MPENNLGQIPQEPLQASMEPTPIPTPTPAPVPAPNPAPTQNPMPLNETPPTDLEKNLEAQISSVPEVTEKKSGKRFLMPAIIVILILATAGIVYGYFFMGSSNSEEDISEEAPVEAIEDSEPSANLDEVIKDIETVVNPEENVSEETTFEEVSTEEPATTEVPEIYTAPPTKIPR